VQRPSCNTTAEATGVRTWRLPIPGIPHTPYPESAPKKLPAWFRYPGTGVRVEDELAAALLLAEAVERPLAFRGLRSTRAPSSARRSKDN
jgi:hypothetical protein